MKRALPTSIPTPLESTLTKAAEQVQTVGLRTLFEQDPQRAKKCSLEVGDIYCDYAKNLVTPDIMAALVEWAQVAKVPAQLAALMQGEKLNTTENRSALHTALRRDKSSALMVDGVDVMQDITAQKAKMAEMVEKIQQGKWLGATGKPIESIVHIGIGGSDLGPVMAVEALAPYRTSTLQMHFVSNIDPIAISTVLDQVNPETTLFIISSKSFTTPETLANVAVAKEWLQQHLSKGSLQPPVDNALLQLHFIAVTANPSIAKAFGIAPDQILTFAPWVGGRYSIWSSIGLPLALSIGMDQFEQFLAGARLMDQHALQAPLSENLPVILALLGAWAIHFLEMPTLAILPYAQGLRRLPDYLQQLDMESNGKRVQKNGEAATYATGPIVWGQAGTNGQHAFYQLLHQGTHDIAIDFILVAQTATAYSPLHQQLLANGLAQSQAMMQGRLDASLSAQEVMQGNRPSNTILLKALTPYALGQLLAMYEHKVFVQGVLWNINSFDQPGVELGKVLAKRIETCMENNDSTEWDNLDTSTIALLRKITDYQKK